MLLRAPLHAYRACQELTARAVGEVTIREAVMEVSVWFEQTDFSMLEHPVKGGAPPPTHLAERRSMKISPGVLG